MTVRHRVESRRHNAFLFRPVCQVWVRSRHSHFAVSLWVRGL